MNRSKLTAKEFAIKYAGRKYISQYFEDRGKIGIIAGYTSNGLLLLIGDDLCWYFPTRVNYTQTYPIKYPTGVFDGTISEEFLVPEDKVEIKGDSMKLKQITTMEELRKLNNRPAQIKDEEVITKGIISVEDYDHIYFLSNAEAFDGMNCDDLKGYEYSYLIYGKPLNAEIFIEEEIKDEYYHAELASHEADKGNEWFTGKPTYVYYTDDYNKKDSNSLAIGLLLAIGQDKEYNYLISVGNDKVSQDKVILGTLLHYRYARPVIKPSSDQLEITELEAEVIKLNARISELKSK